MLLRGKTERKEEWKGASGQCVLPLWHVIFKHKISKARSFKALNYFCCILLTFPQLAHLKTLFHHMLSKSSCGTESSAKFLSVGLPVNVPCFTSNFLMPQMKWNKVPCWWVSSRYSIINDSMAFSMGSANWSWLTKTWPTGTPPSNTLSKSLKPQTGCTRILATRIKWLLGSNLVGRVISLHLVRVAKGCISLAHIFIFKYFIFTVWNVQQTKFNLHWEFHTLLIFATCFYNGCTKPCPHSGCDQKYVDFKNVHILGDGEDALKCV